MLNFESGAKHGGEEKMPSFEEQSYSESPDALRQELDEAKAKAQEYLDGWQRSQADFTNFKKRLELDKLEAIKYANAELMLKILPVLDDFERAAEHVPQQMASDPWVGGVNGIARKLETTLETLGLSHIAARDEVFDPCVHEAVSSVPGPDGVVMRELEKGYKLNERVLRPSKVMVGNGEDNT
ncbi:MAG: nucleotide exchange factor GrpE [Dehalococcoidia bacterium]|nr:nucleotide exchange factor GrpE [Dehalococcoidia bacterium]